MGIEDNPTVSTLNRKLLMACEGCREKILCINQEIPKPPFIFSYNSNLFYLGKAFLMSASHVIQKSGRYPMICLDVRSNNSGMLVEDLVQR